MSPVAQLLSQSVANPYVLSVLIWDRLKRMTPQRARDLTRLLSTALSNALGVLGAERAKQLAGTASRLQDQFVHASVSQPGREVVLNSVATVSRVAQALSTPESKQATRQLFSTVQSIVDFFASPEGRGIFETLGECLTQLGDVAASPEASIFLAELATNLVHALEVERVRREQTQEEAAAAHAESAAAKESAATDEYEEKAPAVEVKEEAGVELGELHVSDEKPLASPASSVAETRWSFETESAFSDAASMRYRNSVTPSTTPQTPMYAAGSMPSPSPRVSVESPSIADTKAARSARIEKEVLLRMGVDPSMLSEIQRVLDRLAEEEVARQRRLAGLDNEDEDDVAGLAIPEATAESGEEEDAGISFAFGIRSSSLPDLEEKKPEKEEPPSDPNVMLLPEWNTSAVHDALRRRHVQATEVTQQREMSDVQAREFASALAQRRVQQQQGGGEMTPADLAACRVIAQMLVIGFGVVMAMTCYFILRSLFV